MFARPRSNEAEFAIKLLLAGSFALASCGQPTVTKSYQDPIGTIARLDLGNYQDAPMLSAANGSPALQLKSYIKKPNQRDLSKERIYKGQIIPSPRLDFGYDFSASEQFLAVGSRGARRTSKPLYSLPDIGPVYASIPEIDMFYKVGEGWRFMTTLTPESTQLLNNLSPDRSVNGFGSGKQSVSISGKTLATVLGWWNASNTLFNYRIVIFELSSQNIWQFKQSIALPTGIPFRRGCDDSPFNDVFMGPRIKLSGDALIVTDRPFKQAAHIYSKNSSGTYILSKTVYATAFPGGPKCVGDFGTTIDGYPGGFVIGTMGNGAYLAESKSTGWAITEHFFPKKLYLGATSRQSNGLFGWQVAASQDLILVGAPEDNSTLTGVVPGVPDSLPAGNPCGAVYGWSRQGKIWVNNYYIKPPGPCSLNGGAKFGAYPISIGTNKIAIGGAGYDASNHGPYLYRKIPTGGLQYQNLIASPNGSYRSGFSGFGVVQDDFFGASIQVLDDSIIVADPGEPSGENTIRNDGTVSNDRKVFENGAIFVFK